MSFKYQIPLLLSLLLACSEQLEPEEFEEANLADLAVSSSGGMAVGLIAIAIPNFIAMQSKANRSECPANVNAIKTAQLAYDASFDTYVDVPRFHPDSSPGKTSREWRSGSGFDTLGWLPDGQVRGSYKVEQTSSRDFQVTCITDTDGDGRRATYTATKSINVMMNTRNDVY